MDKQRSKEPPPNLHRGECRGRETAGPPNRPQKQQQQPHLFVKMERLKEKIMNKERREEPPPKSTS